MAHFTAREWDAIEMLEDDFSSDDRRRIVNAGLRRGRDAAIRRARDTPTSGKEVTSTVIATRGDRLALTRVRDTRDAPTP